LTPIQTPDTMLKRMGPSVIRIVANDANGEPITQGSGFLITTTGLVVTNYHVIKGSATLALFYENGRRIDVEGIAASDPDGDLALVKIKGSLPGPFQFADSEPPAHGALVYAIGNPLGTSNTITDGKVTGMRKDNSGTMLIQTTVAISPGCSGGPLLNEDGKVLGVATNFGQNKSFAIDRARVQKLIDNYKGGVTATSKQQWVSTNADRAQINLWLAKASAEAPKMVADRSKVCSWIAEGYARSGDRNGMDKILQYVDSGDSNWQQQAATAGLRARAGDPEAATTAIDLSTNQRLRLHGHIAIANGLRERGDNEGFLKHMETATEIAKAQKDPVVRGDWLLMVTKTCADAGQFEAAMTAAQLLGDTDDPTLDSRVTGSGTKRNFKSAALAYVGIGKSQQGDHDGALEIAQGIFDDTDKSFLIESIAELRARANDAPGAFETAQQIKVPHMKNKAMFEVAEAFARKSDRDNTRAALAEALGAAQWIKETWRKAEAETRLVSTLAICGDIPNAEKKGSEFSDESSKSTANGAIAVAWAKRGDFKKMAESLAKVKDPWAGQPYFVECAVLQSRSGHLRAACATVARIPNVDVQVETTRAIIKAIAGKLPAQLILDTASKFPVAEQRAAAYLGLAEGIMDRNDAATAATAKVRTDE
ncbi:MAG TPA: serine protease, partial [Tepidisphaeraceae bacterium]|nr:serine protease [Tepidisphaeraceae bacterium]